MGTHGDQETDRRQTAGRQMEQVGVRDFDIRLWTPSHEARLARPSQSWTSSAKAEDRPAWPRACQAGAGPPGALAGTQQACSSQRPTQVSINMPVGEACRSQPTPGERTGY